MDHKKIDSCTKQSKLFVKGVFHRSIFSCKTTKCSSLFVKNRASDTLYLVNLVKAALIHLLPLLGAVVPMLHLSVMFALSCSF